MAAVAVGLAALGGWELAAVARLRRVDDEHARDHAALVGTGPAPPLRLVLLGDSAVDGHGLRVQDALPRRLALRLATERGRPVRVDSLAVSGATSADVLAFQVPQVPSDADVVVVGAGVNDVLHRVRLAAVVDATDRIVAGVRAAATGVEVVVVPCHDLGGAPGPGPVLRRVLGRACRRVAAAQRAALADGEARLVEAGPPAAPAMFGLDGLHPGPLGVDAIATGVLAALSL